MKTVVVTLIFISPSQFINPAGMQGKGYYNAVYKCETLLAFNASVAD